MANVKKSRKFLKNKEIEYGSTKKRYIDKSLEETLKNSGFERKPKQPKPKGVVNSVKIDPDSVKMHLPKNIDSEILIKPEKRVKKKVVKEERKIVDLPSHLEFEAPEKIEVKTGIKRIVGETEGAEYGDLPSEIDIVHEETKEEIKSKKKSFFQNLKQTLGLSDNADKEEEEDIESQRAALKKEIEKRSGPIPEISQNPTTSPLVQEEALEIQKETKEKKQQVPEVLQEVQEEVQEEVEVEQKPAKEEMVSDLDEYGLEPIKFTDKIKRAEIPFMPEEDNQRLEKEEQDKQEQIKENKKQQYAPEILVNDEDDSSIDILYSKPKKKQY